MIDYYTYREGQRDYADGAEETDNPYDERRCPIGFADWLEGWEAARAEEIAEQLRSQHG